MKISFKGALVSSLVAAEDIGLEELEANGNLPHAPAMSVKNWTRTGIEAISLIGNMASRKEKIREPFAYAFYSNTPLFAKALRDMVKEHLAGTRATSGGESTNVVVVQPSNLTSTAQFSPRRGIARNARQFAEAGF